MIVSFFEEGEKMSFEIESAHYLEIQKKLSLGETIDISSYPYDIKLLTKIVGFKGSSKKAKSDIDYEACDYDAQL